MVFFRFGASLVFNCGVVASFAFAAEPTKDKDVSQPTQTAPTVSEGKSEPLKAKEEHKLPFKIFSGFGFFPSNSYIMRFNYQYAKEKSWYVSYIYSKPKYETKLSENTVAKIHSIEGGIEQKCLDVWSCVVGLRARKINEEATGKDRFAHVVARQEAYQVGLNLGFGADYSSDTLLLRIDFLSYRFPIMSFGYHNSSTGLDDAVEKELGMKKEYKNALQEPSFDTVQILMGLGF